MGLTGDGLSRTDIPNSVTKKLEYTNCYAWKVEIVRALCFQQVAYHIGMDDVVYKTY